MGVWLTGIRPSLHKLLVFGTHCHYFHDQKNKLLARGRPARFLGLTAEGNFQLFDFGISTVVTRRHVSSRERPPVPDSQQVVTAGGG